MGSGHSRLGCGFSDSISSHLTEPLNLRQKKAKMTKEQSDLIFIPVFPKIEPRIVEIWQNVWL